jgi:DNA polymerase
MALTPRKALAGLDIAAQVCTRCPLYANATQAVCGEGPAAAALMLVGEQPGDQEDLAGMPFVGPAGKILDAALEEAGIDRSKVYVTNAVKHFKNEPRGKRRLHKRPNVYEIDRCKWWLSFELEIVKPKLVVALGATAVRGVLGKSGSISALRGRIVPLGAYSGLVTIHPSFLLRIRDRSDAAKERTRFVAELVIANDFIAGKAHSAKRSAA